MTSTKDKQDSEEGTRLAVLAGIVAHFQLCRYTDKTSWVAKDVKEGLEGRGRMLVPIVDMLNHESEDPNVLWRWYVDTTDDKQIRGWKGDIVVTSLRDIQEGEELCKEYGWRAGWDIASSYGFVPRLMKERWECSALLLFPAVLDLNPKKIVSPVDMSKGDSKLDLTMETNYGLYV